MVPPSTGPPGSPDSSDSPGYRAITRSENGVTVTKTATIEEFPVPAITFEIRSARATRATVRVLDVVPEEVPLEDIGFHADHGIDYWAVVGDAVVFEREFEPGEAYRTVYGVRSADDRSIKRLLTDPEIEVTDGEKGTEAERTVAEHASRTERDTTLEREPTAERTPGGGRARIDDATVPAAATAEDVAAALATQLRHGNVGDAALDTLRDALGERITRLEKENTDTDVGTGTETAERERDRALDRGWRAEQPDTTVERPTYRLVTDDLPGDLSSVEIEGELRDIAALSEAERREYGNRGLDIAERERELAEEVAERSADTRRS